jgi:NitT/TauT family transport system ATP-binding protein
MRRCSFSTRIIVMTSHPGRVFREFIVDEPEPRANAFRTSSHFADLCRELSAILSDASSVNGIDD